MYINLYSQYQITSDVQIAHKLAHVHKYYGFTFTCIVLFFFLPLFIIGCSLYTSQYRSRAKEINYYK